MAALDHGYLALHECLGHDLALHLLGALFPELGQIVVVPHLAMAALAFAMVGVLLGVLTLGQLFGLAVGSVVT